MRVIAGRFRSRPLLAPPGIDTRPTADRLRETLFNVLTNGAVNHLADEAFLDLYAGSGAVGIEAASRGAASVTFVEQAPPALAVLQKNLVALQLKDNQIHIEKKSVARYLRTAIDQRDGAMERARFGVVFLDPPYDLAAEYSLALGQLGGECRAILAPEALVIAEHRRKTELEASYGHLVRTRVLEQGDAALSFYRIAPDEAP
jgi:16S rRNA (guanine966-N2)-methyltransferase